MNSTLTVDSRAAIDIRAALPGQSPLGLVLLWSLDEPARVGEIVLMPSMDPGTVAAIGRANPAPQDEIPRMEWARQQPGRTHVTGPLRSPHISRTQLHVEAHGPRTLRLSNIGRGSLVHEGRKRSTVIVSPGDLIELRGLMLLMCIQRPSELPLSDPPLPLHAFGEPDAHGIVGESSTAWELRTRMEFVAGRSAHVLVRGPSGTGKELVAQAIHRNSPRGSRPLLSRNAATFPDTLIDAELFGNARNFPNPGMPERPGLIGEADGSTLFLDEFAELPQAMQAHLLRVLDDGEYMRLGEGRPRRADFRLIAATNRPEHALKEDVLARLRLRLEVCGLDQRREDIPLIARHILRRLARDDQHIARRYFPDADPAAIPRMGLALIEHLVRHAYTTHVRELETLLWRAMTHGQDDVLDLWPPEAELDLGDTAPITEPPPDEPPAPAVDPMRIPPEVIQACLDKHGGHQEPVWRELGLGSRHVLSRLVRKHSLRVKGRG